MPKVVLWLLTGSQTAVMFAICWCLCS